MRALILAFALTLASPVAMAESKISLPKVGDTVMTEGIVKLRASSPDPTFGGKGAQTGWLKSGELARVVTVKHYISIFGTEVWVEIEKKDEAKGWIFAGLAKDISKGNASIAVLDSENEDSMVAKEAAAASARSDALIEDEYE